MLRRLGFAACLAIWCASTAALAQPSSPSTQATPSEPERATLHSELTSAITAYEAGDFAKARELFERVHSAAPTARTLRSLALVAFKQERFADAIVLTEASLDSAVKPLTEPMREDARTLLTLARAGAQAVAVSPAPQPSGLHEPSPLESVVAEPPEPQAHAPAPAAKALPANAPPRVLSPRSRRLKRAGIGLAGVTGALLIGGLASWFTGVERLHELERSCRNQGGCYAEDVATLERRKRLDLLADLSTAAFAVAGASALGSATLLGLHYRSERVGDQRVPVMALTIRHAF